MFAAPAGIKCIDKIWCCGQTEDTPGDCTLTYEATGEERDVASEHLWRMMLHAFEAGEVLGAGTGDINRDGNSADTSAVNGLAEGHEYSISKVHSAQYPCTQAAWHKGDWGLEIKAGIDWVLWAGSTN